MEDCERETTPHVPALRGRLADDVTSLEPIGVPFVRSRCSPPLALKQKVTFRRSTLKKNCLPGCQLGVNFSLTGIETQLHARFRFFCSIPF